MEKPSSRGTQLTSAACLDCVSRLTESAVPRHPHCRERSVTSTLCEGRELGTVNPKIYHWRENIRSRKPSALYIPASGEASYGIPRAFRKARRKRHLRAAFSTGSLLRWHR